MIVVMREGGVGCDEQALLTRWAQACVDFVQTSLRHPRCHLRNQPLREAHEPLLVFGAALCGALVGKEKDQIQIGTVTRFTCTHAAHAKHRQLGVGESVALRDGMRGLDDGGAQTVLCDRGQLRRDIRG